MAEGAGPVNVSLTVSNGCTYHVAAKVIGSTDDELRAIERDDPAITDDRKKAIAVMANDAMHRFCGVIPEGRA